MDYKILVLPLVLLIIISNVLTSPVDTNRDKRTIHFIFNHFANALGGVDWNHQNNGILTKKIIKTKPIVAQPVVVPQKQLNVAVDGFNLPSFMAQLIKQTVQPAVRIDIAPMPTMEAVTTVATPTVATTTTTTVATTTTTEEAIEMIPEEIVTTTSGPSKINIPLEISTTAAPQTTVMQSVEMPTEAPAVDNSEIEETSSMDNNDSDESTESIVINSNAEEANEDNSINDNIAAPRSSAATTFSSMNINNQGATFWGRQPILPAQQYSQNINGFGNYLPPPQQYQAPSYYFQPPYQSLPYQGPQVQQYSASHPPSMDLAAPAVSSGHSRVKMHDNAFEHYTYHHPAAPSAIYQPAVPQQHQISYFGNRRWE